MTTLLRLFVAVLFFGWLWLLLSKAQILDGKLIIDWDALVILIGAPLLVVGAVLAAVERALNRLAEIEQEYKEVTRATNDP